MIEQAALHYEAESRVRRTKADLKLFKTRLFRFLERRHSHALPVGGANAPFCLSIANKHQEDEEEGKAEER